MATISVNLSKTVKPIKPMHAGGQPPLGGKDMNEFFHYMTEAGIPFSRLHDVGGAFGGGRFVDIPNLFRNFDADESNPDNYDFTFTDHLIKSLFDAGVEPYFRLGITIENQAYIKPYHTFPPKDYQKWARVCEHVIRHYTEGWANGFTYPIRYWEIWNEPEVQGQQMWCGSDEEYYRLYEVTAKHLKACFPHLKIGGYASIGFYYITEPIEKRATRPEFEHAITFFEGFFRYVKAHECPIDFFSWHSYRDTATTLIWADYLHTRLVEFGYGDLETHLNEWDPYYKEFGTAHHSAEVAAMMLGMQDKHTDLLCIYDMRTTNAPYCPLFDIRTHKPIHAYYSMVAFNALYKLGMQVKLQNDTDRLYAVAASNGEHHAIMLSNLTGECRELHFEGVDLSNARFSIIDRERLLSWAPDANVIENNSVLLIEW